MKRFMHTSGGNHLSKRRRIAKRKKAVLAEMQRRAMESARTVREV